MASKKVLVLGERHQDMKCMVENIRKMQHVLSSRRIQPGEVLFVAEGRNDACYQALTNGTLRPESLMTEHSIEQTPTEMLDKFLLQIEMLSHISKGITIRDEPVAIDRDFFLYEKPGEDFWPLLSKSGSVQIYKDMINEAFKRNNKKYMELYNNLLANVTPFMVKEPLADEIGKKLIKFGITQNPIHITELLNLFRTTRDENIIKRIEQRARDQRGIKLFIVIFGALHFDNLHRLIDASPVLSWDSESTNIKFGGKKYKKNTKRNIRKFRRNTKYIL